MSWSQSYRINSLSAKAEYMSWNMSYRQIRIIGTMEHLFRTGCPQCYVKMVQFNIDNIREIKNPPVEACIVVYPGLAEVMANPKFICLDNPFRIVCKGMVGKLRKRFPMIKEVFLSKV